MLNYQPDHPLISWYICQPPTSKPSRCISVSSAFSPIRGHQAIAIASFPMISLRSHLGWCPSSLQFVNATRSVAEQKSGWNLCWILWFMDVYGRYSELVHGGYKPTFTSRLGGTTWYLLGDIYSWWDHSLSPIYTGWWCRTCFFSPYVGNVIIPTADSLYFSEG